MLKWILFQTHWLLGITAGLVLALVGVTGGLLSFEHEILRALNPGVMSVEARPEGPLAPDRLLTQIRANAQGRAIQALAVSAEPSDAARVTFAPQATTRAEGGPPQRGETLYVDPYTGALLGQPAGQDAMRFIMQLHRWLAAGEIGKQIVGASTVALIVLSLSGLYLRWPRRPLSWRSWLPLDLKRRGRSLFWELHSVIGAWVLPFYLLASLTGLYWSYEWYRGALFDLTGTPRPAQMSGPRPQGAPQGGAQSGAQGGPQTTAQGGAPRGAGGPAGRPAGAPGSAQPGAAPALDIAALWAVFIKESGGFSEATLRLPQGPARTLTISYRTPDAAHERANNTLVLDAAGTVREHRRYEALPAGQKLMASIFVLHSGSYFGLAGLIGMMLASLAMPLFAITGWLLYLDRRAKKKAVRAAAAALPAPGGASGDGVLVAYASQSGTAERLALKSAGALVAAGTRAEVAALGDLSPSRLAQARRALFVVSTFGEGEPPDGARPFARAAMAAPAALGALDYGVLALGDRSYERFCGFGRDLESWLRTSGARPLFDAIEVDGADADALRAWQSRLGALAGAHIAADWQAPKYARWRLVERRLLNPGSLGLPTYHVALAPLEGEAPLWAAGDIAEIGPRHDPVAVADFLAAHGLDGAAPVTRDGAVTTLAACLATSELPRTLEGSPQEIADALIPLPHRDYSIASLPQDARIELLVRQARGADGRLGLGSGTLTHHVEEGGEVSLRIRSNPAFHGPSDDRQMILIGNGTGLAGLRSHLKARIAAGHRRNWLIFGERSAAHDFYYRDEITRWHAEGALPRLDLAFSRDQNARLYVQDRLKAAQDTVRALLQEGAAIYVCGSLAGMAQAVDTVLSEMIGPDALEHLHRERRYCRDVY